MTAYIQTRSGKELPLQDTPLGLIDLVDITYALSYLNRYTGHAGAWTVLQHSIFCLRLAQGLGWGTVEQRSCLMHDTAEAYLGDVATPLKSLIPGYREIEHALERRIGERYGVEMHSQAVKEIDLLALNIEARALLGNLRGPGWPPSPIEIQMWMSDVFHGVRLLAPAYARREFRALCLQLGIG